MKINSVNVKKTGVDVMHLDSYPDLLSVKHLTKIFGTSKNTIYSEIKKGKFGTPIQIGREFKIPKMYIVNKYFANYQ